MSKVKLKVVAGAIFLVFVGLLIASNWWTYKTIQWPGISLISGIVLIFILLCIFKKLRKNLMDLLGLDHITPSFFPKLMIALLTSIAFMTILLLGDMKNSIPSTLQFSIIGVSTTLGGLVIAGANNLRISDARYRELISVAQKLIISAILFILFTALVYTIDLIGGIDINRFDFSGLGLVRGLFYWSGVACFFPAIFLFLIGLMDLALALTRIKKAKSNRTRK